MSQNKKAPWVKWYPGDLLAGITKLSPNEKLVYLMILNLIYDEGGPIRDNVDRLCRIIGLRPSTFEKAMSALVDLGKLLRTDGVISNPRAEKELDLRQKVVDTLRENASSARKKIGKKNNKNKDGLVASKIKEKPVEPDTRTRTRTPSVYVAPKARATRIDPHRKISESNIEFALGRGLTRKEIEFEWQRFVRYYAARDDKYPNARSMDWDTTWESWSLGKAAELNREPVASMNEVKPQPETLSREVWMRSIEIYRLTGQWHPDMGPPPDRPGYRGPPDLVRPS